MSVRRVSLEPISAATAPVTASPVNIQRKTLCRKFESARATATSPGCAAYSTPVNLPAARDGRAEIDPLDAYRYVESEPLRFRECEHRRFLGFEIPVATTWLSRLLGLAMLNRERAGAGLLIPGCRSVHTIGMRLRVDLLFFDRHGRVVEICRDVP